MRGSFKKQTKNTSQRKNTRRSRVRALKKSPSKEAVIRRRIRKIARIVLGAIGIVFTMYQILPCLFIRNVNWTVLALLIVLLYLSLRLFLRGLGIEMDDMTHLLDIAIKLPRKHIHKSAVSDD